MAKLDELISRGEGADLGFKERLGNLDRELVAFANGEGGTVLIGVRDDGTISPVPADNRTLSRIQDTARNCDPPIPIDIRPHHEQVIEVHVSPGRNKPYRCRDGFFLRVGPNTQKLTRDEIVDLIRRETQIHFDDQLRDDFDLEDISQQRIDDFVKLAGISANLEVPDLLLNLNVARAVDGIVRVTNAGVLFFAEEPQRFIRESQLTCVRYRGPDRFDILDRKELLGSPIEQIEASFDFVERHTKTGYRIDEAGRRQDVPEYPPVAIREVVTNAVMHRDYAYDLSHVYLHIFSDRLEVENPGGLPRGLTEGELGRRSVRRNPAIADLLMRTKYVEQVGSGIPRVSFALAQNGNPPFEVASSNFFVIRLRPRVATDALVTLTQRQHDLRRYIANAGPVTKGQTARHLAVSEDTALRELNALIDLGLVVRTGAGRATRYHIQ